MVKLFQGDDSALIKLHISIERHQAGHDIGKTKSSEHTASDRRPVSKLNAHNRPRALLKNSLKICIQPLMCLQHAQGAHAADPEFLIRLLDRIEPQSRQIDQGHFHAVLKLQPHHTAAYNTALFLIQLIGL